jgi:lipid II:glycine glycyltransferase (peptidoglycan interpeptide bridge formation enzyme)
MEVKSVLTGRRGVSLPFTDHCDPIVDVGIQFQDVLEEIVEFGRKSGWRYLELRGTNTFLEKKEPSEQYFTHTLSLRRTPDEIFQSFSHATRKNIRKAERENVEAEFYTSLDSVKEFYRLNSITRRNHGLPPQPYTFFEQIYQSLISKGFGFVSLAVYRNEYIAGALFFHFGKKALIKYSGSKPEFQNVRPNNLIWWKAIKWYHENGYESLSFGRTEPQHESLRQFKKGWGVEEEVLKYYRYNFKRDTFVHHDSEVSPYYISVFRRMPPKILEIIGRLAYRHIG